MESIAKEIEEWIRRVEVRASNRPTSEGLEPLQSPKTTLTEFSECSGAVFNARDGEPYCAKCGLEKKT